MRGSRNGKGKRGEKKGEVLGAKGTLVFNLLGAGIKTENPVLVEIVGGIPVGKVQFKDAVVDGIMPEFPVGRGMEPDIVGTGALNDTLDNPTLVPIEIVGTPIETLNCLSLRPNPNPLGRHTPPFTSNAPIRIRVFNSIFVTCENRSPRKTKLGKVT